ncbi:beta-xylosidase [Coniochaeta sp. 2T2.1]|nr:beta-xylosidase [Coniochaeta sp. 2T2.1]
MMFTMNTGFIRPKAVVLALAALSATLTSAAVAPPPAGWPTFTYQGVVTNKTTLKHNPTNEFIFPSIFHAGEHLDAPLGEWYLYYAPHENPGGISLLYADTPEGPWTEYANNPVIKNVWAGYSVPHVSSPEANWNEQAGRLFVYFHGSNSVTRWAETIDGVTFDYGGVAVENKMGGPNVTETSYARVFNHPNPESSYTKAMFYMGNEKDDIRRIRLAESEDGRSWTVSPDYVVAPGSEEGQNVSGGNFWEWNGQRYVIYHGSSGKSYARPIDKTLRRVGCTPILLHKSSGVGDDVGRVAAPDIVTFGGKSYLFYESGDRLGATIAWARTG